MLTNSASIARPRLQSTSIYKDNGTSSGTATFVETKDAIRVQPDNSDTFLAFTSCIPLDADLRPLMGPCMATCFAVRTKAIGFLSVHPLAIIDYS